MLFIFFFSGLCEVENGQSNIILDIEESRGSCKYYIIYFSNYYQFITLICFVDLSVFRYDKI